MDKKLLEILVCPLCKDEVKLDEKETFLTCVKCKRKYPIKDGIPVMLIEEASIERNSLNKEVKKIEK